MFTLKPEILFLIFILPILFILNFAYAQENSEPKVPEWVKTTAGWYSDGIVSEDEFLNAIKFLVDNKIIILKEKVSESTMEQGVSESIPTPVSKPRLNYCLILNPTFNDLGSMVFKNKYSHVNYINECIKLYRDPIWSYKGEDRIDKLYERFLQLRDEAKQEKPKLSSEPSVKILSSINVGTEKYLVKFNVCAGDLDIDKAKILVRSEIESVEIGSSKDIPANACRTYETQLLAKHTANIKANIVEQVLIEEIS